VSGIVRANARDFLSDLLPELKLRPPKETAMKRNCPICRKPTDSETDADFPFCSERCRTLDLGNWASEKYVVSDPVFDEDGAEESSPTDPDETRN
jgi:uncharacterized protein